MRDFSELKAILESRLEELDARVHDIEDRLDDPVSKDWEDQAVELEDFEVLEDLGKAGMKEMDLIRAALGRIEDGSYGECAKCGDDISIERLKAVPYAVLCRKCAK
ncbi:TraR/DksA family transcriptional regulator [Silicimonas sp. MF1-12-2]|uniref:TraR/DksA family transcriptional regulator n=1 Tax=Silicimonas sp. MF1-12-2 TaxID=3384793 RepID=UPI0039B68079